MWKEGRSSRGAAGGRPSVSNTATQREYADSSAYLKRAPLFVRIGRAIFKPQTEKSRREALESGLDRWWLERTTSVVRESEFNKYKICMSTKSGQSATILMAGPAFQPP